jgi:hypothetical protein
MPNSNSLFPSDSFKKSTKVVEGSLKRRKEAFFFSSIRQSMVKVYFQGTPGIKVIALKRQENVQQFFFLAIFTQYIVDVFTLHKRFLSIKIFHQGSATLCVPTGSCSGSVCVYTRKYTHLHRLILTDSLNSGCVAALGFAFAPFSIVFVI